ncbi:MAG: TauD/TfdA family dioxygenase [Myxococcota bacterium]
MSRFKSYGEQTLHYFGRPHTEVPAGPVGGPAAWKRADVADDPGWRYRLSDAEAAELQSAVSEVRERGIPMGELRAADFPLPTLAARVAEWRHAIQHGLGFQVVSGMPLDAWDEAEASVAYWGLGLHMGTPGAQNPQGDLLGHVRDSGAATDDPFVRLYQTSANIAYHCDAADVVGLLCLRPAKSGGASRIVSSVSVFDEVQRRRPEFVPRLFEPFLLDVRNEDASGALRHFPVSPCRFAEGALATFFHSDYFRSVQRHDDVAPFTDDETALLDLYEGIAERPELYFDMELARGDIQWLSNHRILHARTEYEDHPEPEYRRHLLRLWLSLEAA